MTREEKSSFLRYLQKLLKATLLAGARLKKACLRHGQGDQGALGELVRVILCAPSTNVVPYNEYTSEASVREILLKLDQTMHFIIEDLDTNHLFIDAGQLDKVKAELEKKLAENVYLPPDTVK